jgi:hypothetical protein
MRIVVVDAAKKLEPTHSATRGKQGYVCARINPSLSGDREAMFSMAKRFNAWAPSIAVKDPATAALRGGRRMICLAGGKLTMSMRPDGRHSWRSGCSRHPLLKARAWRHVHG